MKAVIIRRLAGTIAVAAVVLGCDAAVDLIGGGSSSGLIDLGGQFTNDDLSPGGTGGTLGSTVEGADDVELPAELTRSFFTAFQIDPVSEDTAGPKFVVSGDIDQDGLLDLVSAWNQSQPVQLHLQRRDPQGTISFRTITIAGTAPIAVVAGLELGQINNDGWLDIVVLVKATGVGGFCPTNPPSQVSRLEGEIVVMFNPASANLIPDGDRWTEMILSNSFVSERWIHNQYPGIEFKDFEESKTQPEWSGFTALLVEDIDGQPGDDIVVALNPAGCKELGQEPPTNTIDLWLNPGPGLAGTSSAWGVPIPELVGSGPVTIAADAPQVKDLAALDVDSDGDLDIVATWTNAISQNIVWLRNPLIPNQTGGPGGVAELTRGFRDGFDFCVGGNTDTGPCPNGDQDCLGTADGACMAGVCVGGNSSGSNCQSAGDCAGTPNGVCTPDGWRFFALGWETRPIGTVDTGADIMTLGDVDLDGSVDVVVRSSIGQVVQWFRQPNALVVAPEFPPNDPTPDRFNFPWQVFTLTEFDGQEPMAISLGDVTGNGQLELILSVEGGVFWYDSSVAESVFDPWFPNAIIQDTVPDTGNVTSAAAGSAPGSGVGVNAVDVNTSINSLLIVDLDGDGRQDIVGTLDRRSGAGLSDDRLVWYRNTRTDDAP